MANYHIRISNGIKGYGKSHAEYICRDGKYRLKKDEELIIKGHLNIPEWAKDNPINFWEQADLNERNNGRSYKGIMISLPNELSEAEQINLTKDFIKKEIGDNYVCSYAIHTKDSSTNKSIKQPHAHIMLSERKLDGIYRGSEQFFKRANKKAELGGAKKDRSWNEISKVYKLRKSWEELQNEYLEKNNIVDRVDCRKLTEIKKEALVNNNIAKAKLYDREPSIYLNKKEYEELKKISNSEALEEIENNKITLRLIIKEIKKRKEAEYELTKEYANIRKPTDKQKIEYEYTLKEISVIVDERSSELRNENFILQNRIRDMERRIKIIDRIIDNERLEKLAINRLTKNKEKSLEKDYKVLVAKRLKLEKQYHIEKENIPGFFNYFARQEAKEKLEMISQSIKYFRLKENDNRKEYDSLIYKYSYGDNLELKIKIIKGILDQNTKNKEKMKIVVESSKTLVAENNKIIKELSGFSKYGLKLKNCDSKIKVRFKEPILNGNVCKAINSLTREEKSGNAHWNIRLNENNRDIER